MMKGLTKTRTRRVWLAILCIALFLLEVASIVWTTYTWSKVLPAITTSSSSVSPSASSSPKFSKVHTSKGSGSGIKASVVFPAVSGADDPVIGSVKGIPVPTVSGIKVLKAGSGEEISSLDNTIQVNYVGKQYSTDTQFVEGDAVWFPLDQSIPCWQKLLGQRVGDRVEIVCSASDSYGSASDGSNTTSAGAPAGATVWVVDIVGSK